MKEPDLDEEALRAHAQGQNLTIERQTMADKAQPVELTGPNGEKARLELKQEKPGLWTGTYAAAAMGLWRAGDGTLQAIASVGPANPREFRDLISTDARLKDLAAQTGGTVRRLASDTGLAIPTVRMIDAASSYGGDGWIGLKRSDASVVRGLSTIPIFAGLIGLALLLGSVAALWTREGR
jgi:hypothetical protein